MSGIPPKLLVLGLGNPDRGDDAVGPAVADELARRLPPGIKVMKRSGDMLSLIDDWASFDGVICIDAAAPGGEPGRIHRIDLAVQDIPRELSCMSSHAFGLGEAIALGRTLGSTPGNIVVYAIEGRSFDGGAAMTPAVAAAVIPVARQVAAEVARFQRDSTHA